jgi:heme exporter protein A
MYTLTAENLGKRFGARKVFADIHIELKTGQSLALTGRNGAGKSTLILLLLGIHAASRGKVTFAREGQRLEDREFRDRVALVSPYLSLYDQLSAEENLAFLATLAGRNLTGKDVNALLEQVGLEGRGTDFVGTFSSGMKQRLKYAAAIMKNPDYLFLDEPTSNLDADGKQIVTEIIESRRSDSIIVMATNEEQEYALADEFLQLGQ